MKYFSKQFKRFAIVMVIAIVLALGISLVSYAAYGKVYFFDGYTITKVLWVITIILAAIGSIGTLIYGIKDLTRLAKGQPLPDARSSSGGGQPQITVNEQMSQAAQFEFKKRLNAYRAAGNETNERIEAALFAQAVESQTLKAPLSAVFCSIEEMNIQYENGAYTVSGYVDAQNNYGAMVRTPFRITVMKVGGVWKNADTFVSSSANVAATVAANAAIYWIFGIIITVVLGGFIYLLINMFH
ncbi:MAG: hypothetical protein IJU52_06285 [Clostridia bacterium]|nr:hypothetical protein [Clostridia bacterium]